MSTSMGRPFVVPAVPCFHEKGIDDADDAEDRGPIGPLFFSNNIWISRYVTLRYVALCVMDRNDTCNVS